MSRRVWIALAIAALVISCIVLVTVATRPTSQDLKIGAIMPLTGDSATYRMALKKGMDLAVVEVNEHGGIGGKTVTVKYEDDAGRPPEGSLLSISWSA